MDQWAQMEELMVECAGDDLRRSGEVGPMLSAFAGDNLRFVAWVRPFAPGAYRDPLTELLCLAMVLDCDRLALSMGARLTSLDDPIPPVTEDGDLRQRAVIVHAVDGCGRRPRARAAIYPFDLDGDDVQWHAVERLDGGEGWIPRVLELSVRKRRGLIAEADDEMVRSQAIRVVELGHDLWLAPSLIERLDLVPL